MALWRIIWNERNRKCFKESVNSIHKIKSNCTFVFGFWCGLESVNEGEKCYRFENHKWIADAEFWFLVLPC